MGLARPSFTIGIEEEYLLVDRSTRNLLADPDPAIFAACRSELGDRVAPEFLRAQIEVGTRPHASVQDLAADLAHLRGTVARAATDHGAAIIAASTHPFALWWEQLPTDRDRYQMLATDLQMVAHRLVICGMHVHVEIGDPDLRIDLMNQVRYFLPHLLALSTSSPFWGGWNTGLKSYRLNVFRALPRTGLPGHFESWSEYRRHVDVLVGAGIIEDATKIWWDVRPSDRYPTLEMRVSDICTRMEDAVTIAAVYASLLHLLYRLRTRNQRWRSYADFLVAENLWRAQRYGSQGSLMDFGRGELVPFADLVEELIEMTLPDAEELGCVEEVARVRRIAAEGTSAERQLATYLAAVEGGVEREAALAMVVDELVADTLTGV
jgi:glutamate---cysteine ligase / carboxylate-amine ligase